MVIHLQWTEGAAQPEVTTDSGKAAELGKSQMSPPVASLGLSRMSMSTRSTSSASTSQRRLTGGGAPTPVSKGRVSLNPSTPRTPMNLGGSPHLGTPSTPVFNTMRYGRAAVLTAPPKVVAVIETPDVAVGAVDASKRRVVTATRFSSRAGADRTVSD